jgi:hypothetical protein
MELTIRISLVRMFLAGMMALALLGFVWWVILCSRAYGEFQDLDTIVAKCSVPREMRQLVSGMPVETGSLKCQMDTRSNGIRQWDLCVTFTSTDWDLWKERYRRYLSTIDDFQAEKYGEDHFRAAICVNRGSVYRFQIKLDRGNSEGEITVNCLRWETRQSSFPIWLRRLFHRQTISLQDIHSSITTTDFPTPEITGNP